MARGGADRAAVGLELPPGFSAAEKIESLAATLRGEGRYEGGHAWAGPRMLERDGPAEDRFHARVQAARRAWTGTSAARLRRDGSPPGGEFVTLVGSGGSGAGAGEPPVDRAPVTSASQTMSLNAYRAEARKRVKGKKGDGTRAETPNRRVSATARKRQRRSRPECLDVTCFIF